MPLLQQTMDIRQMWQRIMNEEPLLGFEALHKGDKFIVFPYPGDNNGHGGFLGDHPVFLKTRDGPGGEMNCVRLCDGMHARMDGGMPVLKLLS